MLGRPNPYRKTRQAGTLDDLMFDMDKRRHTSFRFQNYQNFITDRPGKFDGRYRQKLSWCALDEETGKLDYLTEGLSPTGGRRASTSSVGSRTTTGDRDSLLPSGQDSSFSSAAGGGGEDDPVPAPSNPMREDSLGGFSSPRRNSLTPTGFISPIAPLDGVATPKPSSGRSWVAPQFTIDPENRAPNVLLEDAPARDDHPPLSSTPAAEDGTPIGDARVVASASAAPIGSATTLSPIPSTRQRLQTLGNSPASRSAGSSGRRSSTSAYSFGTSPTRGAISWARRSGGGSNGSSRVSGGGAAGRGTANDNSAVVRTVKPTHGGSGDCRQDGESNVEVGREGSYTSVSASADGGARASDNAGVFASVAGTGVESAANSVGMENPGREPSYGTVSQAFVSTATSTDRGGSLLASNAAEDGAVPRKSEISTYFSSIASGVGASYSAVENTTEAVHGPGIGASEGQGKDSDGRVVVMSTADPGLLVRPPRVGDGKLEHDKERRRGVAGDLEAVIAELSRRKSSLAWEDGEGACFGVGDASPAENATEEEEELRQTTRAKCADDEKNQPAPAPVQPVSLPRNVEASVSSPRDSSPTVSAPVAETTEAFEASAPTIPSPVPSEAQTLSSEVDPIHVKGREPLAPKLEGQEANRNVVTSVVVPSEHEHPVPRSPATATATVTAAAAIAAANANSPRVAARARASAAATTMKAKARASHAGSGVVVAKKSTSTGLVAKTMTVKTAGRAAEMPALGLKSSVAAAGTAAIATAKPRSPRSRYDAPTASSAAKAHGVSAGAGVGKGSGGGRGETIAQQHRHYQTQQQPVRGREEAVKARGTTASRRKASVRRSMSAPPPGYGAEIDLSADAMMADIITPSDLVTCVRERADGAAPLSGIPGDEPPVGGDENQPLSADASGSDHRRTVPSAGSRARHGMASSPELERTDAAQTLAGVTVTLQSTTDDERSPRLGGVRRGARADGNRSRTRAKSIVDRQSVVAPPPVPLPHVEGTPEPNRKGKYQVKDSFNRLKGWIHGGFAGGSGRKNNAFGGGGGSGSGGGGVARVRTKRVPAGGKASPGGRVDESAGSASTIATKVEGKNTKFSAAANRAAARVIESRKTPEEHDAAQAPRHAATPRSRQESTSKYPPNRAASPSPRLQGKARGMNRGQTSPHTHLSSVSASVVKSRGETSGELAPATAVELIQKRSRMLDRPLQAASAGSSPSPSPSPSTSPSQSKEVKSERAGVALNGCKAPASFSVNAAVSAHSVPAGPRRVKVTRSVGSTALPLSGASRAASNAPRAVGGGGFRKPVESPSSMKSPRVDGGNGFLVGDEFVGEERGWNGAVAIGVGVDAGAGASRGRLQKGRKPGKGGGESNSARRTPKGRNKPGRAGRVG